MARETLLDQRIQEVVRVLPEQQHQEIIRYDNLLREGTTQLEYGLYFASVHGQTVRYSDTVPGMASELVWSDLQLAEGAGFRRSSPQRAMYLGELSTAMARRFAGVNTKNIELFLKSATGLIGLHISALGDMDLIKSDAAKERLAIAERKYQHNFIQPIQRRHAKFQRSLLY